MSRAVTPGRSARRRTAVALAAAALTVAGGASAGLAPAASAGPVDAPPGIVHTLDPWQVVTPDRAMFWTVGNADHPFRLLSPSGTSRPVSCWYEGYYPFGRCWQEDSPGRWTELRRDTRVSEFWLGAFARSGSTDSLETGMYALAQRMGWLWTSGGIFIPPLTPASVGGTYSTAMPLGRASREYVFDVWVHPGFVPGS